MRADTVIGNSTRKNHPLQDIAFSSGREGLYHLLEQTNNTYFFYIALAETGASYSFVLREAMTIYFPLFM